MMSDGIPRSSDIVLASGSSARQAMLTAAGLTFTVTPATGVDEAAIRDAMLAESGCVEASDIALELAAAKAVAVSRHHPGAVVIGADQVVAIGSHVISKAQSVEEAREILDRLRGRTHELVSAVALVQDGQLIWQDYQPAQLTMRAFSDEFLGLYLARAGDTLHTCAGCYALEGLGVQLFERIDGDYFTILGMPLLRLLGQLRHMGLVTS